MIKFKNKNIGVTLVEVIIACSIISICVFALLGGVSKGTQISLASLRFSQANFLIEEGVESVKIIRDNAWTNISSLTVGTTYYLSFDTNTNTWSLSTTSNTIDSIFTRTIVFSNAYRNGTDDLASSGTLDPNTKKVTVSVSWGTPSGTKSKSLDFYIANIF